MQEYKLNIRLYPHLPSVENKMQEKAYWFKNISALNDHVNYSEALGSIKESLLQRKVNPHIDGDWIRAEVLSFYIDERALTSR